MMTDLQSLQYSYYRNSSGSRSDGNDGYYTARGSEMEDKRRKAGNFDAITLCELPPFSYFRHMPTLASNGMLTMLTFIMALITVWPLQTAELLFYAIFGQTNHDSFKLVSPLKQDAWSMILFKLFFGVYMLVSVVVLINLLIAMMSDTYQRIQAQSDIEWKYGLSKLIRNMHRTTTAPSPLNLVTSWLFYLFRLCNKRKRKKERPSLVNMMGLRRSGQLSARSKMGAKWLSKVKKGKSSQVAHKDSLTISVMQLSPLGSQLSFGNASRIESVVDWELVRRKYRELRGDAQAGLGADKSATEAVNVDIIRITENLFFAIFGQKDIDDFTIALNRNMQPNWTLFLFKISFSIYMMVTVIVLINLLIAMMSDTYQNIQSQSDIEWKYGLSKLIRNMQKTTMAPSPLNLVTSWVLYLHETFKEKREIKKRKSLMNGFIGRRLPKSPFLQDNNLKSTRDSLGISLLQPSPLGSQLSFRNAPNINSVVDWDVVRRKYRIRFGGEVEKPKTPLILDEVSSS